MVLTEVKAGSNYIIHAIDGTGDTRLHLEQLGFVPGTEVNVVARMGGSLIVNVKGSRVALDRALAKSVFV